MLQKTSQEKIRQLLNYGRYRNIFLSSAEPADGLIHCKKCRGSHQTVVPRFGGSGYFMPRCLCPFQKKAQEERKAMEEQRERMEQIFTVIDNRYRSKKPLIVTTNLKLEEIKNPPDIAHARIYDRILERCAPVLFSGKNFREEGARGPKRRRRRL
ncbi:hypothetical protein AALC75_07490 [Lachnospiraceae bacterium 48-42]